MRKSRLWLAKCLLVLIGFAFGLAIAELTVRIIWRPQLIAWQRNLKTEIQIDPAIIHGVAGPAHINTNSSGVRGDEWSRDRSKEYRILTIGGSTTECLLNDQPNTWPAQLQTKLGTLNGRKVWVGNAGHGGFNSRHNVLEMRYMLDQYDPDAVVMLIGGNDMGLLLAEGASYDSGFVYNPEKMRNLAVNDFIEKPVAVLKSTTPPRRPLARWVHNLYVTMFAKEVLRRYRAAPTGLVHNVQMYKEQRELRRNPWLVVHEMPANISQGLEGYANNLREIIRLAKERRVRLILMTQPELLQPNMSQEMIDHIWSGWIGAPDLNIYWSPEVAAAVLSAHNELLLKICREEGVECIDLASQVPKSLDVFFDQCHFTDYGCSMVADLLVEHFHNAPAVEGKRDGLQGR
jgi:lysophospholipase L1-like esterase